MFDPTAECVATETKQKKRKSTRSKTTKVTVLLVDPSKGLPKNKSCYKLKENGYDEVIIWEFLVSIQTVAEIKVV